MNRLKPIHTKQLSYATGIAPVCFDRNCGQRGMIPSRLHQNAVQASLREALKKKT
ncbi:hypothetical protein [Roseovarius halotolerans]|uniref:Uncharacterized protein n=1 Tax=Roseovarius halotolerans TaxID=505353 RepID=A0A1X6ZYU3_9RHOB|nr:hypothetical protein ROH8110_03668 [Roseovarius halotolerans]